MAVVVGQGGVETSQTVRGRPASRGVWPDDAELAFEKFQQGRVEDAAQIFMEIVKDREEDGDGMNNAGYCLVLAGKLQQAFPYFEKALAVGRENRELFEHNLGVCQILLGDVAGRHRAHSECLGAERENR